MPKSFPGNKIQNGLTEIHSNIKFKNVINAKLSLS